MCVCVCMCIWVCVGVWVLSYPCIGCFDFLILLAVILRKENHFFAQVVEQQDQLYIIQ